MIFDFEVGDFVRHPARLDWGDGQVQSIIGQIVTVTFEEAGKQVIHAEHVALELCIQRRIGRRLPWLPWPCSQVGSALLPIRLRP